MHPARQEDVELDVTGAIGNEPSVVGATVLAPAQTPRAVLFCVPGGSYDRTYWHLEVPGRSGYSFAEHAVAAGFTCVIIDNLGTGRSTRPEDGAVLTLEAVAMANERARRSAVVHVQDGASVPWVGVGHSMGGALTIAQQAAHRGFDAVAILGTSVLSGDPHSEIALQLDRMRALLEQVHTCDGSGYVRVNREALRAMFHAPDVPDDVVHADSQNSVALPVESAVRAAIGRSLAPLAEKVNVPVFLAYGAAGDISPDPHGEPAAYRCSADITLHLVSGAAHCHNSASHRAALWDRLLGWVEHVR